MDLSLQHAPAQRLATDPDLRADHLASGIHRPVLIKMIDRYLYPNQGVGPDVSRVTCGLVVIGG